MNVGIRTKLTANSFNKGFRAFASGDQTLDYEKVNFGDAAILKVSRLTKVHVEFIYMIQEEISFQTMVFSVPPANVVGHFSNGGFGFFGSYSISYSATILKDQAKQ
jgi:hypothetical protein